MTICKHCTKEFDKSKIANHTMWCDSNPKRQQYRDALINARASKVNFKNQYSHGAKCSDETKEKLRLASTGRTHTNETKMLLKEHALASPHRRLKKNTVMYKNVLLDSSWELALAKRLDELNISWIRPNPLPWVDDDGIKHNYFPDFYLVDYDVFLDPKNPHAVKVQNKKLKCIKTQYSNIVILESFEKCTKFSLESSGLQV